MSEDLNESCVILAHQKMGEVQFLQKMDESTDRLMKSSCDIGKLTRNNFNEWFVHVQLELHREGWKNFVLGDDPPVEGAKSIAIMVKYFLMSTVSDEYRATFSEFQTPFAAICSLRKQILGSEFIQSYRATRRLKQLAFDPSRQATFDFIGHFYRVHLEVHQAGIVKSDKDWIHEFLSCLPDEMNSFVRKMEASDSLTLGKTIQLFRAYLSNHYLDV